MDEYVVLVVKTSCLNDLKEGTPQDKPMALDLV